MKFAFAVIRNRYTELTAATARIPIQTPKKPTVSSVSAKHSKNAKLLTVRVWAGDLARSGNPPGERPYFTQTWSVGRAVEAGRVFPRALILCIALFAVEIRWPLLF
jgi:hypothetical protein